MYVQYQATSNKKNNASNAHKTVLLAKHQSTALFATTNFTFFKEHVQPPAL